MEAKHFFSISSGGVSLFTLYSSTVLQQYSIQVAVLLQMVASLLLVVVVVLSLALVLAAATVDVEHKTTKAACTLWSRFVDADMPIETSTVE